MVTKTVCLLGHDQGAANVLQLVADAMGQCAPGTKTVRIFPLEDFTADTSRVFFNSDAIMLGISPGGTGMLESGLVAAALYKNPHLKQKIFVLQDFPGSCGTKDPIIRAIGQDLHFCSILPPPANSVERMVYGNLYTVGYPDHWIESVRRIEAAPKLRQHTELMKAKGRGVALSVRPDTCIIYVNGFKNPVLELEMIRQVLSLRKFFGDRDLIVHFRPHPGEKGDPALQHAILRRDTFLAGEWRLVNDEATTDAFADAVSIGIADIVIAHPGATAGILSAAVAKKLICPEECVTDEEKRVSDYDYALTKRNAHTIDTLAGIPSAIRVLMDDISEASHLLRRMQHVNGLCLKIGTKAAYGQNVVERLCRHLN